MTTLGTTIQTLTANLNALSSKDREFATSLLDSVKRRGSASEKQAYWLNELAKRATQPKDAPKGEQVGSVAGIVELMDKVTLKRPAILIKTEAGDLRITKAGAESRNPGAIYVKAHRGDYLGKITTAGQFVASREAVGRTLTAITESLKAFAADPAGVAATYGRETGCCCFCAKELTDARSVKVGYGPQCAEHYGLPWGE